MNIKKGNNAMKNIDTEKLKNLKDAKNMTIKEVADKAGLVEGVAAKIFAGLNDNPTLDTLRKLAKALDCIIDDFLVSEAEEDSPYYHDKETNKLAQEIFEDKQKRILMDATRHLKPEAISSLINVANQMKGTNPNA